MLRRFRVGVGGGIGVLLCVGLYYSVTVTNGRIRRERRWLKGRGDGQRARVREEDRERDRERERERERERAEGDMYMSTN
jgi:hypothetical protein